jgi:two-component system, NarL family, response regulator NreC
MKPRIAVLVADDHAVLRSGLRLLIDAQADMHVVAEAADGDEALVQAREARPDVTLFDLTMPHTDAMRTIAQLCRERPSNRVLVLTMHDDPAYVDAALDAGARGYVVKKAADLELLSAIRAVAGGRISLDAISRPSLPKPSRGPRLSPRETQVLQLLGQGYTSRQVAERLRIGVKSAETYRARLAQKLHLQTRAELTRYALQTGLLSAEALERDEPEPL